MKKEKIVVILLLIAIILLIASVIIFFSTDSDKIEFNRDNVGEQSNAANVQLNVIENPDEVGK